jgi:hypothetical protein
MAMRLVLAILLLLSAGCGESQTPTGPSDGGVNPDGSVRVSGRVLDFATGLGVSGANVVFGDTTAVSRAGGSYVLVVPSTGPYQPRVDGVLMGNSRVTGSTYRGDFLVRPGDCVTRYGTIADVQTRRPVFGATVSLSGQTFTSEPDGWYRIDLGCPANGWFGFNTTFIYISHPSYVNLEQVMGRGVMGTMRYDFEMQRR